jgi:hypothetical protein
LALFEFTTLPEVANDWIRFTTAAGDERPSRAIKYAARPAMWGVAILSQHPFSILNSKRETEGRENANSPMLVPEIVLVAVVLPIHELNTLTPGAKTSTKLP